MRIDVYIKRVRSTQDERWQLYRLLGEPVRLRLLALAAIEELAIGELAELLGESQPNVSRHSAPLRQAGLLAERRDGSRLFVRVPVEARVDPVVSDALGAGARLCGDDGSLGRVADIVRARDAHTREFFSRPARGEPLDLAPELPAVLYALHRSGALTGGRALDAGSGAGALLDVLAPLFDDVIAVDRSSVQLERARQRVDARGYQHVRLVADEIDGPWARAAAEPGVETCVCVRMLHHAPLPRETVAALARLLAPGGRLVLVDYQRHDDQRLAEQQADVWLGFEPSELAAFAAAAGLEAIAGFEVPRRHVGAAFDGHLGWQVLTARRPDPNDPAARRGAEHPE